MAKYTIKLSYPGVEIEASSADSLELAIRVNQLLKDTKPEYAQPGLPALPSIVPAKSLPELPPKLAKYCESWSEPWAIEDSKARAYALHKEHGNWETAYQELLKQDGEGTTGG